MKWEQEGSGAAFASAFRQLARRILRAGWPGLVEPVRYDKWILKNEPDPEILRRQRSARFPHQPLISVVTVAYSRRREFLDAMIRSLVNQTYENWELCIVGGGGENAGMQALLGAWEATDSRIKVRCLREERAIAENSNAALALATGEFTAFLDQDDTLAPFALYEIARAVNRHPDADFLYSDEDKLNDKTGERYEPHFKPAWSPDLLRACNYIAHLTVVGRRLLDQVGGFRTGFEGAQDYDLILRATERARCIVHIPHVLYHRRMPADSAAGHSEARLPAHESARKALREHLGRCHLPGTVRNSKALGIFSVRYALPKRPLVSIVIPSREHVDTLRQCLNSLWLTDYAPVEVIIVENGSHDPRTHDYYATLARLPNVKVVIFSGPFNHSAAVNFGVSHSTGEILLQLNNDIQAINSDWLERMLDHALRPEVGAVGAKLYYPDNRIQHAGVVVGMAGVAGHCHVGADGESCGYAGRLVATQNCSAVTGACLMTRRDVFDEVHGLDEEYPLDFNDVDFCLKIRERGYLNVWTPLAELYHFESLTRGKARARDKKAILEAAVRRFQTRWSDFLLNGDPYYNPNLTLHAANFELSPDTLSIQSRTAEQQSSPLPDGAVNISRAA
jgi:GT2 family glycosyltransferase